MIGRQAAGRHDAVHVRTADEGLAPRGEDAQATDLGSQMARVGGHLAERGRKAADLALVDGDLSTRIGDLRQTRVVMLDGKLLDADALRRAAGFSGRPK